MVDTNVELIEKIRLRKDCTTCVYRLPQPCRCGPDAGTGRCSQVHPLEKFGFIPISSVGTWILLYRPQVSCCLPSCCGAFPRGIAPHDPVVADAPDCPGWAGAGTPSGE